MMRGRENSRLAVTLSSYGSTPFFLIRWPKMVILGTEKMHFFLLK